MPAATKTKPTALTVDMVAAFLTEAGARNSAADLAAIQKIHDHANALGASCVDPGTGDPTTTEGANMEAKRASERRVFQEATLSHGDIQSALRGAISARYPKVGDAGPWVWVKDVYDDSVVYEVDPGGSFDSGQLYQASYSLLDGKVTLGDAKAVYIQTTYQPVGEAARLELSGDLVALEEKAVRTDGTMSLKVINAGWGSSGYYGSDVLKRDGPTAFPSGTHMYVDHPTATEEASRPERSVKDLAAQLTGDAHWDESGAKGPGLYADATVFGPWKDTLNEMAPAIGVSIRASGTAKAGTAEGRAGKIIESITAGKSVDFVTVPGRGGEILSLYESARGRAAPGPASRKDEAMDLQETQTKLAEAERQLAARSTALAESEARAARATEALVLRETKDLAHQVLAGIAMKDITRTRIAEAVQPILKDGALDREALTAKVKETAAVELKYLEVAHGAGAVRGMGSAAAEPADAKAATDRLSRAFRDLGLSESGAAGAAAGRSA